VIRHLVGALETERFGRGSVGHAELILPPPQELLFNHDNPTSSHVRLRIIRIGEKYLRFMGSCVSIDPRRHAIFGPRIR